MINGRNTDGKFTDGNGGRPKGSRNKATIAIDSLLEGQAEALTQTAISKALDGDSIALRLCMDRIAPPMKDKPVVFPLVQMRDAMDASQAAGSVLSAVSDGTLTPMEGTRVMGLIDSYCQTNENSHRIAGAALIYALNSWRHSVRAAVRLILKLSRE